MHETPPADTSFWGSSVPGEAIPVARPRLPTASQIAPYLVRIDANRWYSNNGPLVQEFEERLAGDAHAVTVANATLGLSLALQAQDVRPGALCLVPAWTFAATAHAVLQAGLVPWIVDADAESWALEPAAARALLDHAPGDVAAVMPVAPFGAPVDAAAWDRFRAETGVAVVLDAAASFDTVRAAAVPTVVSLHATKVIGVGEGGYVLTSDEDTARAIRQRAQFGFWGTREAAAPAANAKLSEYGAAVGLAALDTWDATRDDFQRVLDCYRSCLDGTEVELQRGLGLEWVTSTAVVDAPGIGAEALARALATERIGSRRWWGGGLHRHSGFSACPRTATPVTDVLAASVIGLPCWPDLDPEAIALVCEVALATAGTAAAGARGAGSPP